MKKKRSGTPDAPTNGGRWFLTYSDMITLLLALFIMLYSMSALDLEKYKNLKQGFAIAFGTATGSALGTGTGSGTGNAYYLIPGLSTSSAPSSGTELGNGKLNANDALGEVYAILAQYIKDNNLQNEIELKDTGTYVQIRLKDVVLFNPNSAEMLPSSKPVMKEIEAALAKVYNRIDHITISGHTADVVVDPQHSDELSWQLSTERATTVLAELTQNGLPQKKLSIQGYAQYDPVATNSTEEGRSKNRRVEISVFKNPSVGTGATGRENTTVTPPAISSAASSAAAPSKASGSSSTSAQAPKG